MNRGRRKLDPPSGLTGSPLQQQQQAAASKPNRLSRSFRQTQQTQVESPRSQQAEFKTPTRIPRSRTAGGFSEESPHNDSDLQQDIIWDATSPSPNRLGKRGKKQRAGVVDISEIVSRIAPKHGRPKVAEPTLQQWIGDSAAIPCTPDVQVPKPKKKSPRPNGVDDLLKLAKQFDFNLFRQDEEEVEDLQQQSPELLTDHILDFESGDENDLSPSLPGICEAAVKAGTDVQVHLDQHMDDDLDFLFDGPTQHVSGNLSQMPSQVKPASGAASKEASGKPSSSSHGPDVSTTTTKYTLANDEFDDDWDNDDLLNDSLVLEMTQNPQNFAAPKHCSTQKPSSDIKYRRESPVKVPVSGGVGLGRSAASKVEKDNVRQRATFKLESNPNFSVRRVETDTWTNSKWDYSSETAAKDTQQSRFSAGKGVLVQAGPRRTREPSNTARSDPQRPQFQQRPSADGSNASIASNMAAAKTPQIFSSHHGAPAVSDLLDDDLNFFFSSDPVWDDPADDDLLREMCEDVENQIQRAESVSAKQTLPVGHVSNQRAALQPSNRTWNSENQQPANQQPFPPKPTSTTVPGASRGPAVRSSAGGCVSNIAAGVQTNALTDCVRFTQAKTSSACVGGGSGVQSAPQGNNRKDQFTFKKPNNPVSTVTNKVVAKCSAAEIELKKQQAMERRRQRLQAAQNLRAPT